MAGKFKCGPQCHASTHTLQMDRVLLLNNAGYVDSIKDTWAERAGHHGQISEGSNG